MRVVIAGGHGKIALLLERILAERGDQAVGLIRNPAHVADVQQAGAEAVVCDLEAASADDVAVLLSGADAVVFAAGAGAGSGAPRKDSVDRGASVLMAGAAGRAGVRRFVQISSMGAGQPPQPGRGEVGCLHHGEDRRRGRPALLGPGLDHPAPRRPHRCSCHRPGPARGPAAPRWHGPPRRRRRGHRCPARRARYPASNA
jgi:nucleoside-diphosphate-sugar epimerase